MDLSQINIFEPEIKEFDISAIMLEPLKEKKNMHLTSCLTGKKV